MACLIEKSIVTLCLVWQAASASAQDARPAWEPGMDLLTAGAAASIVLHQACSGSTARAAQAAGERLRREASLTPTPDVAFRYAEHAFEIKVKALWQSSAGDCRSKRLRDIALHTGFEVPN